MPRPESVPRRDETCFFPSLGIYFVALGIINTVLHVWDGTSIVCNYVWRMDVQYRYVCVAPLHGEV
jgi:hypothetical protein